ncbi:polysaccharide deacetylase family protein [Plantactinospora sp. KBS50]|uniref:polysaccharide deacetylase family protein n=1 Tax=Plantactinospora sp. KBS50 TaxID=2024580 RepID=UPI000BAAEB20|nr:polysaccharide deacetylase family protein [Plantactinospora sp. KBS50]
MNRRGTTAVAAGGLLALAGGLAHALPAATVLPTVRLRWFPRLSGRGAPDHVALTFDDGPDPASTPAFLEVLAAHRVRATFFLLGRMVARSPALAGELVAAGHEVAVHGWSHRNLLLRDPGTTYRDLARARDVIAAASGRPPVRYRPPYGVLTGSGWTAARRLGLRPVLWTCWGRDWTATATAGSVLATVRAGLAGGGTVLLHDSDCTAAPGAWRSALGALPDLLAGCAARGWRVGPLAEHFGTGQGPKTQCQADITQSVWRR